MFNRLTHKNADRFYISAELSRKMLTSTSADPSAIERLPTVDESTSSPDSELSENLRLSPREHEVLRCYLAGMSVSDIASKFSRSPKTISAQKQSAYRKLGIRSDAELFASRKMLEEG
ncbi:hypothetical protein WL29_26600 [Burkholderia ubonensis]|uniref:HTH luxR-type domain-containing protein n=1 Tax=Burkholderia ubonensis TaxID=101571 RepID=A0A119HEE5_9BURK|nr:hypothetical protein WL29_26600 [Burkholderia ubonensis]